MNFKSLIIYVIGFSILSCQFKPKGTDESINKMTLDSANKILTNSEENLVDKLNAFKATNIIIDKTNSEIPILRIEVSNTKRIDDFKGYLFVLDIYDIISNKKIDSYGFGSTFKESKVLNGNNSIFLKKNYSLEPIINENKSLQNLFKTVTMPSNNLQQFNLRTEFIVEELQFGDGTIITQPKWDVFFNNK